MVGEGEDDKEGKGCTSLGLEMTRGACCFSSRGEAGADDVAGEEQAARTDMSSAGEAGAAILRYTEVLTEFSIESAGEEGRDDADIEDGGEAREESDKMEDAEGEADIHTFSGDPEGAVEVPADREATPGGAKGTN